MRIRPVLASLALLACLAVAACGSSDDASTTGAATAAASSGAEPGALPAKIEHKFGSTTVTKAPERVAVVGLREQDALLALGIVPVATTEWFGERPGAIFPWAEAKLGSAEKPEVLPFTDGIQFEKVAAARPDLIVAVYSGLTKDDYDKLSAIAPTIAQPPGQVDWGSSWQDEITTVGRAVGQPKAAAKLRDTAQAQLDAAKAAHPEFAGQTAAVATPYQGIYVYGPEDARTQLMEDLGFTFPEALHGIGGGKDFGGQLSEEKLDLIDTGTLLWFANPKPEAKLRANPLYNRLAVSKEGRDVFLPERGTLYEATSFISVLSIPYLIDELVPRLAAAADGDPATKVDAAPA